MFSKTLANELIHGQHPGQLRQPRPGPDPDWIKTAKQLTADNGGDWQGYSRASPTSTRRSSVSRPPRRSPHFFVFLCSERASYCVGSTYFVDGGMLKVVN